MNITKELPTGLLTKLDVIKTPEGDLQMLTVFCNKEQSNQIMNAASKLGMPHERFDKGIKIFN